MLNLDKYAQQSRFLVVVAVEKRIYMADDDDDITILGGDCDVDDKESSLRI